MLNTDLLPLYRRQRLPHVDGDPVFGIHRHKLQVATAAKSPISLGVLSTDKVTQLVDQVRQLLWSSLRILLNDRVHIFTVIVGPTRPTSGDVVTQQ